MHFSRFITAGLASVAIAAPIADLENRAATTVVVVDVVTVYTTVYPHAPSSKPNNGGNGGGFLQQSGSGYSSWTHHHHHSWSSAPSPVSPAPTLEPTTPCSSSVAPPPAPATTSTAAAPPPPAPSTSSSSTAPVSIPPTQSPSPSPSPSPSTTTTATSSTSSSGSNAFQSIAASSCGTFDIPSSFDTPPSMCGRSWLDSLNQWRAAYGKSALIWSSELASIALTASAASGGDTSKFHHTNLDGSYSQAEVMAGGWDGWASIVVNSMGGSSLGLTPFEHALVQGWLCESPTDSELSSSGWTGENMCPAQDGYVYSTDPTTGQREKGHWEIVLGDYDRVGCSFTAQVTDQNGGGVYVCDYRNGA